MLLTPILALIADLIHILDGPALSARFNSPCDLAIDSNGNVLIADAWNDSIRTLDVKAGFVTTLAGFSGHFKSPKETNYEWAHGYLDGPTETASFASPVRLVPDGIGGIFVGEDDSQGGKIHIRYIAPKDAFEDDLIELIRSSKDRGLSKNLRRVLKSPPEFNRALTDINTIDRERNYLGWLPNELQAELSKFTTDFGNRVSKMKLLRLTMALECDLPSGLIEPQTRASECTQS